MSRYSGNDYPRDRRTPPPRWNPDRRASYIEAPRGRGSRELRDAPPLGARPSYRDSRDFSPRGVRDEPPPRQRRDSRDGPLSAGPSYEAPAFRGGFGRGRGDPGFRGGRGGRGRFPDERDLFPRERSRERTPPYYRRDERSPDRRDDRPYIRRDEPRWNDRDRERDLRREPLRPELRAIDMTGPTLLVNPDRMALIAESSIGSPPRRSSLVTSTATASRRDSDIPAYLNGRAENPPSRYGSRASSPPTQPPPVPAFTLSFAPAAQVPPPISKPAAETKPAVSSTQVEQAPSTNDQTSSAIPTAPRAAIVEPPRAPRAGNDAAPPPRNQAPRSWELTPASTATMQPRTAQPASPAMHTMPRPGILAAPTGPKADRTPSQPSVSPRLSFSALSSRDAPNQPLITARSRSPPFTAPSGPRSHVPSISPEVTFAPTAPKADRAPPRHLDRPPSAVSIPDRNTLSSQRPPPPPPPGLRQGAWNQWRRDPEPAISVNDFAAEERRRRESKYDTPRMMASHAEDRMDVDPTPPTTTKANAFNGHSAQQSFFGKPTSELEDEQDLSDAVDDTLSTTDEDELEVEDLALFEAKFERQRRELEAKLIDLSAHRYRATTPLESLARLARITMKDVERFHEQGPDMEIDGPQSRNERSVPPATHSSESEEGADLPTPKDDDNTTVLIRDAEDNDEIVRRIRRPTPDAISLPFMTTKGSNAAFQKSEELRQDLRVDQTVQHDMETGFAEDLGAIHRSDGSLEDQFAALYQEWREHCETFDYEREELERIERHASFEPGPELEQLSSAAINPIIEGRRLHKFSSQYEIEQVLKESEETARIEQEKVDREAKKVQADMEKEAVVPDQLTEKELWRSAFIDDNRLREPETLTVIFTYEPAPDDFTENEQQIFLGAFKETPKKWSEIASLLPGREPKDCIRHYYANKWDGRYRDARSKRQKGGPRRGRGVKAPRSKATAMADLARADDLLGPVAMSDSGRPKRAAAPTNFAERETEAKALLAGQSPAKRAGPSAGGQGDAEKPAKRRRAAGDKPGRKAKGAHPLASLAAAPTLPSDGRAAPHAPTKESLDRSRLEDASLLAGFSVGRPALHAEPQTMFAAVDAYMPRQLEDPNRLRAPMQAQNAKPSPSSYWSVPEQTDFNKYIKHFGTDFGAIATHMGTKTQTMIKNHYQRQVDGGNRPDLEHDAMAANARRERGEDMGAPPVPTPITKRKYDQPPTATSRTLVAHGDAMDIDDGIGSRSQVKQHGSPPQFPVHPQYQQGDRPTSESSATPILVANQPSRQYQPRASIYTDHRAEARPTLSAPSSYLAPLGTPTGQPAQSSRTVQEAQDPLYIESLLEQQRQAMRLQGHYQVDRTDVFPPRGSFGSSQHSPIPQSVLPQGERKPARVSPPPIGSFFGSKSGPTPARGFDTLRYPPPPPPPKREDSRASIGSGVMFSQSSQPTEPPKRSNVMSLLNDTEEPKQAKRNSLDQVPSAGVPRHASPAQQVGVPPAATYGSMQQSYGPGQSQYARQSMSGPAVSSSLKQEPLSASSSGIQASIPPKHEWPARTVPHGTHTPPTGPPYDRGGRPPFHSYHGSMLGQLGASNRGNPSPPPLGMQHSRTPSLSIAEVAHHRPSFVPGPASGPGPQNSGFHAQQTHPPPPFPQPSSAQTPAHDHQQNQSSLSTGYPPIHQRAPSRDERPGQYYLERERERERERSDRDWRWRQEEDAERRRAEASRFTDQRQYEPERSYPPRPGPPMPPQQIHTPYTAFEQNNSRHDGGMNMREQSMREAHLAMQQEEERFRSSAHYREREQAEEARRRHDDAYMSGARRTPLGVGFGAAPGLPPTRR